jgi:hypothetical protein
MGKDINESKLIGGKRKNGHKFNCICHICENMKNKATRGGYEAEVEKEQEKMMGGSKKKNGHRKDCKCPICKNMQNSKKRGGSKLTIKTKKMRGQGSEQVEKEDMEPRDLEEVDEESEEIEYEPIDDDKLGGKKKRGNGHKANCQCPICKNMRKKKGGALESETGDIEEGGIKSIESTNVIETKATDKDYDALDAAEKGEAGLNVVGGTRKRRGSKKCGGKKRRKTRKARKHH